jgi:regulator of replication initiation timing
MTEPVQIYLNKADQPLEKSTNNSETYIIKENQALRTENQTLRESIKTIQVQSDNFEEEVDSHEKSIVYMRGLLKNFVAIHESYKKIASCYKLYRIDFDKSNKNLRVTSLILLTLQYFFLFISWSSSPYLSQILCLIYSVGLVVYIFKYRKKVNYKKFTAIILKEHREIKKIENACDFLHNYIEHI